MLEQITLSLYSLFSVGNFKTLVGAAAYNWDYKGEIAEIPFIKVHLVFQSGLKEDFTKKKISGLIVAGIFTKSGEGQLKSAEIADNLDTLIQDKLISGIQLGSSTLQDRGIDKDNGTLLRYDYVVPFTYYGDK